MRRERPGEGGSFLEAVQGTDNSTLAQRPSGGAKGISREEHPKGKDQQEWKALRWQERWYIQGTAKSPFGRRQ